MIYLDDLEELIKKIKSADGNVCIDSVNIDNDWRGEYIKIKYYNNNGFLCSEEKYIENIE